VITVFYDGKCSLCYSEIEYYKRTGPEAVFEWVDITVDSYASGKAGIDF
jgi:predicted DCC family thiol-disulfide oxidoreductase YuxK